MFTDIVGYTKMTQTDESLALELLEEQKKILRSCLMLHGGTEVKTMGDAFLIEFRSALDALSCAVEVQRSLRMRNVDSPPSRRLDVRIGIHLGDVVHRAGDVFGDAVNVASRIEPIAEPGGICLSQQVYDHVRNKSEVRLMSVGEKTLKNVDVPVAVYRVALPWAANNGETARPAEAPKERLAVLPFVNISPDPNDEFFADGLTEEMISKLSEIRGLKVIARTSVMNYKRKEKSVEDVGRELQVGSVIEGSVRKAGSKIRVSVQLVDAHTSEHMWASNYDSQLDDIFAIQSDIASKVANSLSTGVFAPAPSSDTRNVQAYTFYIRGMQLLHEGGKESLKEAATHFERAVAADPDFAKAHAGLARTLSRSVTQGYEDFRVIDKGALPAATRSVQLGPNIAESHAALSEIYYLLDRYEACLAEARRAVEINPSYASAFLSMGIVEASLGRLDKALASCEKAFELDPLSMPAGSILSLVCRAAGDMKRSLEVLDKMKELNPRNSRVYSGFAEQYIMEGDLERAQGMLDEGLKFSPKEPVLLANQGMLYAVQGRRKEAEEILALIQRELSETAFLYSEAFIRAALGDVDEAIGSLMKQADIHSWPFLVHSLPVFAAVRKDPRYKDFCAKVGLPQ
jgi:adenylate cyclase